MATNLFGLQQRSHHSLWTSGIAELPSNRLIRTLPTNPSNTPAVSNYFPFFEISLFMEPFVFLEKLLLLVLFCTIRLCIWVSPPFDIANLWPISFPFMAVFPTFFSIILLALFRDARSFTRVGFFLCSQFNSFW